MKINLEKLKLADKLIDTDIIIEFLRGDKALYNKIFGHAISVITISEIYYGEVFLHGAINGRLRVDEIVYQLDLEVIDIDFNTALKFSELKLELNKKGQKIEDMDLFVASTSIVNNIGLLTNNKKHFSRIKQLKLI